jgi:hypothetical protein
MQLKKGDILTFNCWGDHPDCIVISDDGEWVNIISTEGVFITYKRGYLISNIAGGWISFKRYGKELEPDFMVKKLEWV